MYWVLLHEKDTTKSAVAINDPCNEYLYRELNFGLDKKSGKAVITVRDRTTGETIRSIPSEQVLRISRELSRSVELLFKPHS